MSKRQQYMRLVQVAMDENGVDQEAVLSVLNDIQEAHPDDSDFVDDAAVARTLADSLMNHDVDFIKQRVIQLKAAKIGILQKIKNPDFVPGQPHKAHFVPSTESGGLPPARGPEVAHVLLSSKRF